MGWGFKAAVETFTLFFFLLASYSLWKHSCIFAREVHIDWHPSKSGNGYWGWSFLYHSLYLECGRCHIWYTITQNLYGVGFLGGTVENWAFAIVRLVRLVPRHWVPLLVSLVGIVSHHWYYWAPIVGVIGKNWATSLGGIVPHCWHHWEELSPIVGAIGRNYAPSFVSLRVIVHHRLCHWEEFCPFVGPRAR